MGELHEEKVSMLIDWLTVTFHHVEVAEVKELLGLGHLIWEDGGFKQNGYLMAESMEGLTLSYGANHELMAHTVNLSISGSGCRYLEQTIESWQELLRSFIEACQEGKRKLNFTRIDIAIDDKREESEETMSIGFILGKVRGGECVSRFRKIGLKFSEKIKHPNEPVEEYEEVLTLGSRSSEVFFRIYDKRLEQLAKLKNALKSRREELKAGLPSRWIRFELEIKGNHANTVGGMLAYDMDMGKLALGILNNNLELRDVAYKRNGELAEKKFWTANEKWRSLIGEVEKVQLSKAPKSLALEQKILYIEKACGKTLAMIRKAEIGISRVKLNEEKKVVGIQTPQILSHIILEGRERLDHKDEQIVSEYVAKMASK